MSSKDIAFSVNFSDIRSIKNAQIDLSGITVMCGCNGSGKSTISKLIYGYLYTDINFEEIVLSKYYSKFFQLQDLLCSIVDNDNINVNYPNSIEELNSDDYWQDFFNKIDVSYNEYLSSERKISNVSFNRYKRILYEITDTKFEISNIEELISKVKEAILTISSETKKIIDERNVVYLESYYARIFEEKNVNWKYQFFEYGDSLLKKSVMEKQHSFSKVIYIDMTETLLDKTAVFPRARPFQVSNSFLKYIKNDDKNNLPNEELLKMFSNIMKGTVSQQNVSSQYIFTNNKGESFSLSQCATGIKSFASLEMLCKKGHFSKNTLIIIDEPEVHLHPQWVIEYARLLIKIHKLTGTRFLLASHNPDFISALNAISEKEKVEINFYLSENESDKYVFKNLKQNIEPIFESFNVALDRIYEYSSLE